MSLSHLSLNNFRNIEALTLEPVNGININTISMGCLSTLFTMYASILLNLDKMSIFTIGLDVSQLILICCCWYTWLMFYMYYIRRQNNESFSFYNRLIAEEDVVIDHQRTNYNFIFWSFCSILALTLFFVQRCTKFEIFKTGLDQKSIERKM